VQNSSESGPDQTPTHRCQEADEALGDAKGKQHGNCRSTECWEDGYRVHRSKPTDERRPDDLAYNWRSGESSCLTKAKTSAKAALCRGGLSPTRLQLVLEQIENFLGEPVSIEGLASVALLSRRHFATAFKQSTGTSPHRYVMSRRIERAKRLLTQSGFPIAEVGYQIGFSSQAHFTTMFRKLVGMTPGAFRASCHQKQYAAPTLFFFRISTGK